MTVKTETLKASLKKVAPNGPPEANNVVKY